jgi:hypothetical protein
MKFLLKFHWLNYIYTIHISIFMSSISLWFNILSGNNDDEFTADFGGVFGEIFSYFSGSSFYK